MTVHVSVRSISALLLLCVSLLGLPADAPAQSVAAPPAAPTLAERLDRLAAEFDRNRIDLHVPGAVLAIVRGEEVIFARGFGVADVEKKTPVTPETRFFIGSTTKAFTATLVGMLVDEGRMQWDDPVEKYLPEFKLEVQSKDPNDRATLRDVLSHRTGFTRMGLLETNTGLSSDEILRRASSAEAMAPFRQRFLYNNEHYLAAGSAAAVAAGTSWHALVKARILDPLGMAATRTSVREAWNDPRTARGYWWDEAGQTDPAGDVRDAWDQHRRHRAGRRDQFHGPRHDRVASFPAAPGCPGRQSAHQSCGALDHLDAADSDRRHGRLRHGMDRARLAGTAADRARRRDRGIQRPCRSAARLEDRIRRAHEHDLGAAVDRHAARAAVPARRAAARGRAMPAISNPIWAATSPTSRRSRTRSSRSPSGTAGSCSTCRRSWNLR